MTNLQSLVGRPRSCGSNSISSNSIFEKNDARHSKRPKSFHVYATASTPQPLQADQKPTTRIPLQEKPINIPLPLPNLQEKCVDFEDAGALSPVSKSCSEIIEDSESEPEILTSSSVRPSQNASNSVRASQNNTASIRPSQNITSSVRPSQGNGCNTDSQIAPFSQGTFDRTMDTSFMGPDTQACNGNFHQEDLSVSCSVESQPLEANECNFQSEYYLEKTGIQHGNTSSQYAEYAQDCTIHYEDSGPTYDGAEVEVGSDICPYTETGSQGTQNRLSSARMAINNFLCTSLSQPQSLIIDPQSSPSPAYRNISIDSDIRLISLNTDDVHMKEMIPFANEKSRRVLESTTEEMLMASNQILDGSCNFKQSGAGKLLFFVTLAVCDSRSSQPSQSLDSALLENDDGVVGIKAFSEPPISNATKIQPLPGNSEANTSFTAPSLSARTRLWKMNARPLKDLCSSTGVRVGLSKRARIDPLHRR